MFDLNTIKAGAKAISFAFENNYPNVCFVERKRSRHLVQLSNHLKVYPVSSLRAIQGDGKNSFFKRKLQCAERNRAWMEHGNLQAQRRSDDVFLDLGGSTTNGGQARVPEEALHVEIGLG